MEVFFGILTFLVLWAWFDPYGFGEWLNDIWTRAQWGHQPDHSEDDDD